ncbi:hypothetical protein X777_07612, partial [Ooceraea biroi]
MLTNFLREYNANRVFLSSVGLWPFQNKIMRNFLRTFCILLEISYCPFEVILLYDHWDDSKLVFDGLYQLTVSVGFLVRIMNDLWNYDKLQKLYQAMDEHWDIFTNKIDVRVLKEYSTFSRKFTIYFSILLYIMSSAFIIVPLKPIFLDIILPLNESRPRFFAIELECRLDKNEHFLLLYFYTTTIIVVGITIIVAIDTVYVISTTHACSLFASVRIVYVLDQVEEVIRFAFLIIGASMILLLVCYPCQRLMDESQNVFHRAYAAEWYNYSPRLKYLLIITLYRSNIPCGLKAGNMVPLSIATYAA